MDEQHIRDKFISFKNGDGGDGPCEGKCQNSAIMAVKTLLFIIEQYKGLSIHGLITELKEAQKILGRQIVPDGKSRLAVTSACAQFIRYTTLTIGTIEYEDMSLVTQFMLREGEKYLKRCQTAARRISVLGHPFVFDGARIIVHSHSRVVIETLRAVPENIFFTVYSVSQEKEEERLNFLKDKVNIDLVRISDAEVATRMENVDMVFVGAEAVVKNGGIINKVGTLALAIIAKEMNKPMYVFAESFKFSLLYPLNQNDIPTEFKMDETTDKIRVDYTPPKYLTLLVTDRGLLTPVAVCDELIEMYM